MPDDATSLACENPHAFFLAGVGNVVEKQAATWRMYKDLGVKLHAADIRDGATGRPSLPEGTSYYNWTDEDQLRTLVKAAQTKPFDFAYVSTYPSVHIFTALRLDFIAKQFIFPKPVDSNFISMKTLHAEQQQRSLDLVARSCVHDHYRNKPLTHYLRAHIADLHRRNGYLKTIRVFITERKSIQAEWKRRESLECGLLLDLCPHALSVIYEIVPPQLTWEDSEGNTFRRVDRRFEVVSTVRAQDNNSILHNPDSETFAALHLRGIETIQFIPHGTDEVLENKQRDFHVLIVIGKGVSVGSRDGHKDLKAIELEFDGNVVRGNFDTNGLAGVIDSEIQKRITKQIDPRHRGLNLPLQQLADNGFTLEKLGAGELVTPFQTYGEAFSIACLLEDCKAHQTAQDLFHYHVASGIADLVNRCHGRGLSSKWALDEDDLARLVFGSAPPDAIP